jgi:hypothetical protein
MSVTRLVTPSISAAAEVPGEESVFEPYLVGALTLLLLVALLVGLLMFGKGRDHS